MRTVFFIIFLVANVATATAQDRIRVMSFNVWHGGEAGGQPLAQTVAAIRAAKADIVGMQEAHGAEVDGMRPDNGRKIADLMGWFYFPQGERTAILSRFPMGEPTPKSWGVEVKIAKEKSLWFFNAHFSASPYQPYQLLDIPYGDGRFIKTESEAIDEANLARGNAVSSLLGELQEVIAGPAPVVLTGDFNEPSHQDWTAKAAEAGCCPLKVLFPATQRIAAVGLIDSWRKSHPDEVAFRGLTWTPTTSPEDRQDHHDRIDYVFVDGSQTQIVDCQIVGESDETSDLVLSPWPSDHRAVVTELTISD